MRLADAPRQQNMAMIALITLMMLPAGGGLEARAQTVSGDAYILDGDTLEIDGTRVRLSGIDAPEMEQVCRHASGRRYRCGAMAKRALIDRVAGQRLSCRPESTDRYGRQIATCFLGRQNLNAWMVRQGWAIAYRRYSTEYVGAENRARRARRGIWSGSFEKPWRWRRKQER